MPEVTSIGYHTYSEDAPIIIIIIILRYCSYSEGYVTTVVEDMWGAYPLSRCGTYTM